MLNSPPSINLSAQPPAVTNNTGNEDIAQVKGANPIVEARNQLNAQIVQASLSVSIGAGDNPQGLVLRSALDRINDLLAPELGSNAIQNAMSQDNSPEATADRILVMTGFLEAFKNQRPGADSDQVTQEFVDKIRSGFEKGFNEAKEILEGLGVFNGDVKDQIMKTFELVQKGLDDFLANNLSKPAEPEPLPAAV